MAAPRASSSERSWRARATSRAASARVAEPDDQIALDPRRIGLQSPRRPPISAPRFALSTISPSRVSSLDSVREKPSSAVRWLGTDQVAHPFQLGSQLPEPAGHVRSAGSGPAALARRPPGRLRAASPRAGRRPVRRWSWARRVAGQAGVQGRVQAAQIRVDRRSSSACPNPPGVPGGQQQVIAVGDRLPERHREHDVAGQARAAGRYPVPGSPSGWLRAAWSSRSSSLLRWSTPGTESIEVVQRVLGRERGADFARAGPA